MRSTIVLPASITAWTRTAVTAGAFSTLLAGCAVTGPDTSRQDAVKADAAVAVSLRAARQAVDISRPRMSVMSARQVMLEWGTRPVAPGIERAAGITLAAADPGYLSVSDIVAHEVCHGCEQKPYHHLVLAASKRHGVPPGLIHAVILKESAYRPRATSNRQARGLMQITPQTGRFLGVKKQQQLYDPHTNIHAGTAYLKYLMGQHDSIDEVLAAYNAGSGNVRKYNGVPPFQETRRYVREVRRSYATHRADQTAPTAPLDTMAAMRQD